MTNKESKAFVRYCYSVLVSSDTIEEVLEKMEKTRVENNV